MPAYMHYDDLGQPEMAICPSCVGLPMYVRDVQPRLSMARIDLIYECSDCGTEIQETIRKQWGSNYTLAPSGDPSSFSPG
jgi:hypothetical protein